MSSVAERMDFDSLVVVSRAYRPNTKNTAVCGDPDFFSALQFEEHVFHTGEMEVERSVGYACGLGDGVGFDDAGSAELGDDDVQAAAARLEALGLAPIRFGPHPGHGLFVARRTDSSQWFDSVTIVS